MEKAEASAGGATRALLGELGFIFFMVGIESLANPASPSTALITIFFILGAVSWFAAVMWGWAKIILSERAQEAISNFSQSRFTKNIMIFLVIETIMLVPIGLQLDWPYLYPPNSILLSNNKSLTEENAELKHDAITLRDIKTMKKSSVN